MKINFFKHLLSACLSLSIFSGVTEEVRAAGQIQVICRGLDFSLSVESLETFAQMGKVSGNLKLYSRLLKSEALEHLRKLLLA